MKNAEQLGLAQFKGFGLELRLVTEKDLPLLCRWRNEPEIRVTMQDTRVVNEAVLKIWLRKICCKDSAYAYMVYSRENPVGFFEVRDIDSQRHQCEDGIFFFGGHMGKGYGCYLALCREWLLARLNIDLLISKVRSDNRASLRFQEMIGSHYAFREGDFLVYHATTTQRRERLSLLAQRLRLKDEWASMLEATVPLQSSKVCGAVGELQ